MFIFTRFTSLDFSGILIYIKIKRRKEFEIACKILLKAIKGMHSQSTIHMKKIILALFILATTGFMGVSQPADTAKAQAGSIVSKECRHDIFSLMPLLVTENGVGFGISIECILDRKGLFAWCLPLSATFNFANSDRIYDYNTGNYNTGKTNPMFYTMPGLKWYPTGYNGKLKYAAEISLVAGFGQKSGYLTDLHGLNETEQVLSHQLTGFMFENSLNLNLDKHVSLSAEAGVGTTFFNKTGGKPSPAETLAEGAIKIGYRF